MTSVSARTGRTGHAHTILVFLASISRGIGVTARRASGQVQSRAASQTVAVQDVLRRMVENGLECDDTTADM
ncbi:hypothetical protein EJ05DRAFT_115027 [Pseudovirgaria hyperparasitica]|uniref:Uncharacterized protein n=1 Tax=Pseudovirgaria hyperparasitica TaxID=470096 RepID=A0A6A6W1D1_9PEZI|nr:uncharacterized protein EJ05DRAFT_115027 [Pseudovirgaria hyperparasitica]KAF2755784.1 hypothetical protein EJ05DRAFT_115027 [Pseudovirgaria hyperparasitica]